MDEWKSDLLGPFHSTLLEKIESPEVIGIMIVSENRCLDLIQDSVGRDSGWTRAFRAAWGLEAGASQYQSRGAAALTLYRLTAGIFDELIPEKHREVVNKTLQLIKEAGYL
jgi:hypothetical protein